MDVRSRPRDSKPEFVYEMALSTELDRKGMDMRHVALVAWLLVPIAVGAYHFGPGQDRLLFDDAEEHRMRAGQYVLQENWSEAVAAFDEALDKLPAGAETTAWRLRLEKAKAQMFAQQLPEAHADLRSLVDEMADDPRAKADLLADARSALASSQYFMCWLMRLEGLPREIWKPEIESARQNYRLLADSATDPHRAMKASQDLEAAIRLARMNLSDLQGLPLPKQCCNCCSKAGRCNGTKNRGRKKPNSKNQDNRGASSGPPPDNRGS